MMRRTGDPASRYFRDVYPVLRGARGLNAATRLTRRATEPGQRRRLDWVLRTIGGRGPARVLDVGCGQGVYSLALARLGHDVTGLDFSEPMLEAARSGAQASPPAGALHLVLGDARTWIPPRRYDIVLCIGVAEYYADAGALLRRIASWADGLVLITMSRADAGPRNLLRQAWLGLNGMRSGLYGAGELRSMLAAPEDEVRVESMRWTHCVSVRRGAAPPLARPSGNGTHAGHRGRART